MQIMAYKNFMHLDHSDHRLVSDGVSQSSLSCKTTAMWLKYQDFSESPKTLVVNK